MNDKEWTRIAKLLLDPAECIIHRLNVNAPPEKYSIDDNTKLVLVSDFLLVRKLLGSRLDRFLKRRENANIGFLIADINARVGEIPSFRELMEG